MNAKQRKAAQECFLAEFALAANVSAACRAAGVSRAVVYKWRERYPDFGAAFDEASEEANDAIRAELFRRAVTGWQEPAVSAGQLVYEYEPLLNEDGSQAKDARGKPIAKRGKQVMLPKHSDSLLALLAKARMPEFREKQEVKHSGILEVIAGAHDALVAELETLPDVGQIEAATDPTPPDPA